MLVEAMPKSEQVQESMDILVARETQKAVLAWGNDASNSEVQGTPLPPQRYLSQHSWGAPARGFIGRQWGRDHPSATARPPVAPRAARLPL